MNAFVRWFGGALGALVAIALDQRRRACPASTRSSIGDSVLLAGWIGAWSVIGFSILPYVTLAPAQWLIRRVDRPVDRRVRQRRRRLDRRPDDRRCLLGPAADATCPMPYGWLLPIGTVLVTGPRHDGPDRRQARRPVRRAAQRRRGLRRRPSTAACRRRVSRADGLRRHQRADRWPDHGRRGLRASCSARSSCRASCVAELQHIADNRDPSTPRPRPARPRGAQRAPEGSPHRSRAERRGSIRASTRSTPSWSSSRAGVAPAVLTNDYNLNRVAQLRRRPRAQPQPAGQRAQARVPARRRAARQGHPAGQGARPGPGLSSTTGR